MINPNSNFWVKELLISTDVAGKLVPVPNGGAGALVPRPGPREHLPHRGRVAQPHPTKARPAHTHTPYVVYYTGVLQTSKHTLPTSYFRAYNFIACLRDSTSVQLSYLSRSTFNAPFAHKKCNDLV